ncbi:hypothetical protein LPE509_00535 [Legionella pneumophila subsp. pneumophila LPE509]|nr:hypothetical protein LPE509_00535 [Legionella pneumophila subsp. pneumophila LPE509]
MLFDHIKHICCIMSKLMAFVDGWVHFFSISNRKSIFYEFKNTLPVC